MGHYVIRKIRYEELDICAELIGKSFGTVAKEFQLTPQNCPTNGAFITRERLISDWEKGNLLFGLYCGIELVGFMELEQKTVDIYALEKLAVNPLHRHKGYGQALLNFACDTAAKLKAHKVTVGIIEENTRLKQWYQANGFDHKGTKQFSHLPFTVGFMEKSV